MNKHAPGPEIRARYRCLEWRGRRWTGQGGKTYIRAYHRTLKVTMYYCFEDDFAWFAEDAQGEAQPPGMARG